MSTGSARNVPVVSTPDCDVEGGGASLQCTASAPQRCALLSYPEVFEGADHGPAAEARDLDELGCDRLASPDGRTRLVLWPNGNLALLRLSSTAGSSNNATAHDQLLGSSAAVMGVLWESSTDSGAAGPNRRLANASLELDVRPASYALRFRADGTCGVEVVRVRNGSVAAAGGALAVWDSSMDGVDLVGPADHRTLSGGPLKLVVRDDGNVMIVDVQGGGRPCWSLMPLQALPAGE